MGCDTIAIKDMAGLLTPYTTAELVKATESRGQHADPPAQPCHLRPGRDVLPEGRGNRRDHPRHLHLLLRRRRQPPLHGKHGRRAGRHRIRHRPDPGRCCRKSPPISAKCARNTGSSKAHSPAWIPACWSTRCPGGMISNLSNQLKEQGALDRMDEVLAEIPRVREDLGFPPLVTPTSQIVGTQAVLNVLTGERYKSVTNEVKNYLHGRYGKAPGAGQRRSAQHRHRQSGSHHLPPGRPCWKTNRQAARRNRKPGQDRGRRADLRHVPGTGPHLPAGTRRRRAQAGTAAADGHQSGLRSVLRRQRVQCHAAWRNLPHPHHRHPARRRRCSARSTFPSMACRKKCWWKPSTKSKSTVARVASPAAAAKPRAAATRNPPAENGRAPRIRATSPPPCQAPSSTCWSKPAQKVKAGDAVLVIEAMKMENEVQAPITGTVIGVFVAKGDASRRMRPWSRFSRSIDGTGSRLHLALPARTA